MKRFRSILLVLVMVIEIVCSNMVYVQGAESEKQVISGFAESVYQYEFTEKLPLSELMHQFPEEVVITCEDGSKDTVSVTWECIDDYENTEYDLYIFEMNIPEQYVLSETLTSWDIPYAMVSILHEETEETAGERISYAGNTSSTLKLNTYLGSKVDLVRILKEHENDNYYLGTEFYWGTIDTYMCLRPYGEYGADSGMNCVGFVASVLRKAGADLSKITTRLYGHYANASNWNDTVGTKNIQSYRYTSVSAMLKSGKLEKGDIVYFEPDWQDAGDDCHIGIFWGDTSSEDKFWHSTGKYDNAITHIHSGTDYQYVYIFKTQKYGTLTLKGSLEIGCPGTTSTMKGAVYKLYNSSGNVVKTLTMDANGKATGYNIPVGTYTLKQTTAPTGVQADTASYTVKITNGNVTTKSLKLTAKTAHVKVVDAAVAATCEVNGLTEGSHCSACGEVIVAQKEVVATGHTFVYTDLNNGTHSAACSNCDYTTVHGHTYTDGVCPCGAEQTCAHVWDTGVDVEPSCETRGYTQYTCTICNDKYIVVVSEPLGHTEVVDAAVEATCTETGLTEGSHCDVCGEVLVEQLVTDSVEHTYNEEGICSACGAAQPEEPEEPDQTCEHQWDLTSEAKADPESTDCIAAWNVTYTCNVCGETKTEEAVKGEHTEMVIPVVAPTCKETGLTEGRVCSVCGEVLAEQETVAALMHMPVIDEPLEATCTRTGLTAGSHCGNCGETLVAQTVIAKTGHVYKTTYTVDRRATMTTAGSQSLHCSVCNAAGKAVTIAKISSVSLSAVRYSYTGNACTPSVKITDASGNGLKKDTDYTVTYASGRKNVGTYAVTVTFTGKYAGTKKLSFTIQPAAPKTVSASLYGYDDVKVSWSQSTGATSYNVYYKKSSASSYTKLGNTTGTSYSKADLADSTTYTFKVVPCYGSKVESAYSKTVNITTRKPMSTPTLKSIANSKSGVTLKWSKVAVADGYHVYRKVPGGSWSRITTIKSASTVSYTDKTAAAGKKYTYTVRAYIGSERSTYNKTGLTILRMKDPSPKTTSVSSSKVKITWTKVSGAKGYYVYRKNSSGAWKKIATIKSGSTTSYTDSYLMSSTSYTYTVKAYNGTYYSSYTGVTGKTKKASYASYKTTARLNYRTGPGTSYKVAGTFSKGKKIKIETGYSKKSNGYNWYRFKLNSKTYYVAAKYLKKV